MAVDGNWNITMSTPMGERNAPLTLKNAGGALTGTMAAEGNSAEIFDGKANGDDVVLESLHHQPDAADARVHRQGFGRQHFRRNGHRPDGQFPVHGDAGVRHTHPDARRLRIRAGGDGDVEPLHMRMLSASIQISSASLRNDERNFAFSRRDAPEFCRNIPPSTSEGAGNAGRPMRPQPRVQW